MTYGKPGKLILDFFIKPVLDYSDLKGGGENDEERARDYKGPEGKAKKN